MLARKPSIVLVDELAHTNAPGSRHPKRYQDVEELIEKGIDVYTAMNIQHFESQVDTVAQITGIRVQETVPDTILDAADEVQVIDIPLEELTQRLGEGKVYIPEQARRAMENFFQRGNLVALRELTLTLVARKMGSELVNYMRAKAISGPWPAGERVMACIGPSPYAAQLLRKAYTIAKDANAEWYAAYVSSPSFKELSTREKLYLAEALNLAEELGAKTVTLTGTDVATEILRFAAENNITRVVVGKPIRSRLSEFLKDSPVHKLLHAPAQFETPSRQSDDEGKRTCPGENCHHCQVRAQGLSPHGGDGRHSDDGEPFPAERRQPRLSGLPLPDRHHRLGLTVREGSFALCLCPEPAHFRLLLYGAPVQHHHVPRPRHCERRRFLLHLPGRGPAHAAYEGTGLRAPPPPAARLPSWRR